MRIIRYVITLIFLLPALTGPILAQEKVKVVATFSILADLARQVGGERVEVSSLVGPNGDAHVFQPSPADARKVADAKVVVLNGLGLEGWLERFIKASGAKPQLVVASRQAKLIAAGKDDHGHGHSHSGSDPHAWQDIGNAKAYVTAIRDGLAAADPAGKDAYAANTAAYVAQLDALEAEIKAAVAAIPAARRKVITTHDAFAYFARAYGIKFIAPQGVSTEAEATARDVARIIRQVKAEKVPAVFLENVSDDRLIQRIAKESGAKIGGKVYSDALSEPNGPAGTYLDMMRNNTREFSAALKP
jgi:zinc/manganese transport system substrate-binding protein